MSRAESIELSRRRMLAMAGLAGGAALLGSRPLLADGEKLVRIMLDEAAKAKITVRPI